MKEKNYEPITPPTDEQVDQFLHGPGSRVASWRDKLSRTPIDNSEKNNSQIGSYSEFTWILVFVLCIITSPIHIVIFFFNKGNKLVKKYFIAKILFLIVIMMICISSILLFMYLIIVNE